ncbi:hypothetical protein ACJA23_01735 [Mycoplasma corogypsi]|uniref:hypothetical protein n=1 Tax=Mycoplasma corogypsi TaxID=2106 RepID=UPI003872B0AD
MLRNGWYKFIFMCKNEFRTKRFWIVQACFISLILVLFLVVYFASAYKGKVLDSFAFAFALPLLINVIIIIFKLGFLSRSIANFKDSMANHKKINEERKKAKMSQAELHVYKKTKEQLNEAKKAKTPKSKFPFVFEFIWNLIALIPLITLSTLII